MDHWGQGIAEDRTVFLGASGQVESDQHDALRNWKVADSQNFLDITAPFAASMPISTQPSRNGTGIELNQPGLDKMEANCPIVKQWVENPLGWQLYPVSTFGTVGPVVLVDRLGM